jgi:predicted molibdopterin-dependent oxidoreductase YjgC
MSTVFLEAPKRLVDITVDGTTVRVPEGATLLEACRQQGIDTPTLCYLENLTPVNVCRVCVVEVEKSRTLVPACSRKAEPGMVVHTDSERVRTSRRMVLEFLASSVDVSLASPDVRLWMERYGADPSRYDDPAPPHDAGERDAARPGEHHPREDSGAGTVAQPVKVDNGCYVRDYSRCILCYKCVEACGEDAQNTFAIGVGRPGVRRPHLHRVRRRPARLGLCLLRQLHRGVPDRRADVQERVRHAAGRLLG